MCNICRSSKYNAVLCEFLLFLLFLLYNFVNIAAAKQTIGLKGGVQRKVLNLAQLRRNKRKCPDKMAGHKRPRTADMDVVAAPDADPTFVSAAVWDIGDAEATAGALDGNDDVEPLLAADTWQDVCHSCDSTEPPARKNPRQREINWVKCDNCPRWCHVTCVGVCNTNAAYKCDFCEWTYASCFHNVLFGLHFIFYAFNDRHSEVSRTFILLFFVLRFYILCLSLYNLWCIFYIIHYDTLSSSILFAKILPINRPTSKST